MTGSEALLGALKSELKAVGMRYAQLAERLGMSESSVKRMFAQGGHVPLARIDAICAVLGLEFHELARRVAEQVPLLGTLTLEQEKAVVADLRLLLVATCCLSQWPAEQIVATYRLSEAEVVQRLVALDRLGVLELRTDNRYRLRVAKGFRWLPDGPVMQFFRRELVGEYFSADFAGEGEMLLVVHGQVSATTAATLTQRLARIGEDFSAAHLAEQHAPGRRPYTLVVGLRGWLLSAFRDLQRDPAHWPAQR